MIRWIPTTELFVKYREDIKSDHFDPGSGEPYDHTWETHYSSEVLGVSLTNPYDRGFDIDGADFRFEEEFKVGDIVHVVAVTYGSGDTFGHSTGRMCIEGVYTDLDEAKKIARAINTSDKEYAKIEGKSEYAEWMGYFETLEDVQVHTFVIEQK